MNQNDVTVTSDVGIRLSTVINTLRIFQRFRLVKFIEKFKTRIKNLKRGPKRKKGESVSKPKIDETFRVC